MNKFDKDLFELYFQSGVDIANRRIFLYGEIDESNIKNIIQGIYAMDDKSSHSDIEIILSSNGGDVYEMFALHDVIRATKTHIKIHGTGKIMSAAVLLMACGDIRTASENTSFMIHVPSWGSNCTTVHNHNVEVKEAQRLWNSWYSLMGLYTKKDSSFWKKLCDKKIDVYLSAEEALELGIIDQIIKE